MKIILCSLGVFLLAGSLGIAQPQPQDSAACGFTVQGEPTPPTITGPEDLVSLVHVLEQPDSPIEIVSVDLNGMSISFAGDGFSVNHCHKFKVRNRSDRVIQGFEVNLGLNSVSGAGVHTSSPLAPGQSVEIPACGGYEIRSGGAAVNRMTITASVRAIHFGECFYRPSVRVPRSLGLHRWWISNDGGSRGDRK